MKTKSFDCVEMKHRAARNIARRLRGMTRTDELSYWHRRYQEMQKQRSRLKAANRGTPS